MNKIASFNAQAKENNRLPNDNSISDFGQRKMIEALHPRRIAFGETICFFADVESLIDLCDWEGKEIHLND